MHRPGQQSAACVQSTGAMHLVSALNCCCCGLLCWDATWLCGMQVCCRSWSAGHIPHGSLVLYPVGMVSLVRKKIWTIGHGIELHHWMLNLVFVKCWTFYRCITQGPKKHVCSMRHHGWLAICYFPQAAQHRVCCNMWYRSKRWYCSECRSLLSRTQKNIASLSTACKNLNSWDYAWHRSLHLYLLWEHITSPHLHLSRNRTLTWAGIAVFRRRVHSWWRRVCFMSLALKPSKYGTHTQRTLENRHGGRGHDVRHCTEIKGHVLGQHLCWDVCACYWSPCLESSYLNLNKNGGRIQLPRAISHECWVTAKAKMNTIFSSWPFDSKFQRAGYLFNSLVIRKQTPSTVYMHRRKVITYQLLATYLLRVGGTR